MDCGCGIHHGFGTDCGCGGHDDHCGCGQGHGFQRRFHSKKEKLEMLTNYQRELEEELIAVKEKIASLGK